MDPPCIWLIQIPFADDIRPPTINTCLSVADPEDGKRSTFFFACEYVWRRMQIEDTMALAQKEIAQS